MRDIEKSLKGKAKLINVPVFQKLGSEIGELFGVSFANTHLLLNDKGDVIYRSRGKPDPARMMELIDAG